MSKFAVLGYGVVGSGVVELFYKNKEKIQKTAGHEMDVKYILDIREFPESPYKDKIVDSIDLIVNDDEITTVAECMGGVEPAFTFTKQCLEKGKSVCTSNKELVASKGDILFEIAKKNNCNYFYEASVGGAIPIMRPLHRCLAANDITSVEGILNGTTNFILTKMIDDGMQFDDALKLAQKLGYAESDPAADIEGHDACRKICIISSLVFGKHVYPGSVYTKGITDIQLKDVQIVDEFGAIKLIAQVRRLENGKILPAVMPMIVPKSSMLSNVTDVFNAIMVNGDGIDKAMFYGRGAGKLPTASAVVGDVIEAEKHNKTILSQCWESSDDSSFIEDHSAFISKMYFRAQTNNNSDIENICGNISYIYNEDGECAFITDKISMKAAADIQDKLAEKDIKVAALLPVLDE